MPEHIYDVPDDEDPPAPGDVLRPLPAQLKRRAWYIVDDVRPVESRVHPNRWRIRCHRVDRVGVRALLEPGARVIHYTVND